MRETDFDEFCTMLDDACRLLSRGAYAPDARASALFFRQVARWSIDEVRDAFDAHLSDPQRGRFPPTPADIVAQLKGAAENDGRPGAEEAWTIALQAMDEAASACWTAEIAQALPAARVVLANGDEVGARMAFREVYTRLVDDARARRRPVEWSLTFGHDPQRRAIAARQAVELGRLPAAQVPLLLEAGHEHAGDVLLLADQSAPPPGVTAAAARALAELHALGEQMRAAGGPPITIDTSARDAAAEQKAAIAQRVEDYERRTAA